MSEKSDEISDSTNEKFVVHYKALEELKQGEEALEELSLCLSNDKSNDKSNYEYQNFNVKVVGFRVNESNHLPFLSFCLIKNRFSNSEFQFIPLKAKRGDNLFCMIDFLMMHVFQGYFETDVMYDYKGYCEYNGEIYVFLDFTQNKNKTDLNRNMDKVWFVLPDEILNTEHVCNIPIQDDVIKFFLNHSSFLYLYDENGNEIETPTVVYSGTHAKDVYFQYLFGNTKMNKEDIMGIQYYFTDFIHAVREGGWSKDYKAEYKYDKLITEKDGGKYIKGGVIRYAIFLGNCFYKIDNDDDKVEKEDDTIWESGYDSVFFPIVKKDETSKKKNFPLYVVKYYKNQISLSYHFIDKQYLGNVFDENASYHIK